MNKFYCHILITFLTVVPYYSVHALESGFIGLCHYVEIEGLMNTTIGLKTRLTTTIRYQGGKLADKHDNFSIQSVQIIPVNPPTSENSVSFGFVSPATPQPLSITMWMRDHDDLYGSKEIFRLEASGAIQGHKYYYDPAHFNVSIQDTFDLGQHLLLEWKPL